jgi:hypothetical protein
MSIYVPHAGRILKKPYPLILKDLMFGVLQDIGRCTASIPHRSLCSRAAVSTVPTIAPIVMSAMENPEVYLS